MLDLPGLLRLTTHGVVGGVHQGLEVPILDVGSEDGRRHRSVLAGGRPQRETKGFGNAGQHKLVAFHNSLGIRGQKLQITKGSPTVKVADLEPEIMIPLFLDHDGIQIQDF